jgi:acetyl esterase/lipase
VADPGRQDRPRPNQYAVPVPLGAKLAKAISDCLSNPRYTAKAREMAASLDGTDGVARTVRLIEEDGKARNVPVTSDTPPTLLLQAENDPVDSVNHSLAYYNALKNARVSVEMHLYAQGGHGFGRRRTEFPITGWPRLVEAWLRTIGAISR